MPRPTCLPSPIRNLAVPSRPDYPCRPFPSPDDRPGSVLTVSSRPPRTTPVLPDNPCQPCPSRHDHPIRPGPNRQALSALSQPSRPPRPVPILPVRLPIPAQPSPAPAPERLFKPSQAHSSRSDYPCHALAPPPVPTTPRRATPSPTRSDYSCRATPLLPLRLFIPRPPPSLPTAPTTVHVTSFLVHPRAIRLRRPLHINPGRPVSPSQPTSLDQPFPSCPIHFDEPFPFRPIHFDEPSPCPPGPSLPTSPVMPPQSQLRHSLPGRTSPLQPTSLTNPGQFDFPPPFEPSHPRSTIPSSPSRAIRLAGPGPCLPTPFTSDTLNPTGPIRLDCSLPCQPNPALIDIPFRPTPPPLRAGVRSELKSTGHSIPSQTRP